MQLLKRLNELLNVPFEDWPSHGINLAAVSANADGRVNSGITRKGKVYFYRKWDSSFTTSSFVLG